MSGFKKYAVVDHTNLIIHEANTLLAASVRAEILSRRKNITTMVRNYEGAPGHGLGTIVKVCRAPGSVGSQEVAANC